MADEIVAQFSKRFSGGALIEVDDFRVSCGGSRITVLFGPSGAGKTTLLRCLAGLERPDEGRIYFGDEPWFDGAKSIFQPPQARNIGYLSQDYALFPHLSVAGNVAYGLHGLGEAARSDRVEEVLGLLDLAGLSERKPGKLSGGQQQRVALARAVARRPRLLLLDEPLSALDSPTRLRLRAELRRLLGQLGVPTLLVTHDRVEALTLGDDVVVLHEGRLVQRGAVEEVFSRPASRAVAEIVAVETVQAGQVVGGSDGLLTVAVGTARLSALAGDLPAGTRGVFVCIQAGDVILIRGSDTAGSPRNHLPATVQSVNRQGPMVVVELDCGFPLTAWLTRQACEELELKPGEKFTALVKAPNVHLIPR